MIGDRTMKVLNDMKGNIDGKVILSRLDCRRLHSAIFYYLKEEPSDEEAEGLRKLQAQLKAMIQELSS